MEYGENLEKVLQNREIFPFSFEPHGSIKKKCSCTLSEYKQVTFPTNTIQSTLFMPHATFTLKHIRKYRNTVNACGCGMNGYTVDCIVIMTCYNSASVKF